MVDVSIENMCVVSASNKRWQYNVLRHFFNTPRKNVCYFEV